MCKALVPCVHGSKHVQFCTSSQCFCDKFLFLNLFTLKQQDILSFQHEPKNKDYAYFTEGLINFLHFCVEISMALFHALCILIAYNSIIALQLCWMVVQGTTIFFSDSLQTSWTCSAKTSFCPLMFLPTVTHVGLCCQALTKYIWKLMIHSTNHIS